MAGFATDTTEMTVVVTLPDTKSVRVRLTYDGVNPEPEVDAWYDGDRAPAEFVSVTLIDGIASNDEYE